jgi:uncharacterized protein (TIGR03083 family)
MDDAAAVYVSSQRRILERLAGHDRNAFEASVPACPAWTVRQTVAHVVAGIVDSASGNMPELDGLSLMDHWKDRVVYDALERMLRRQIDERAERSVAELCDEWQAATSAAMPMLRGERPFPPGTPPLIEWTIAMDVTVHEDDLRSALRLGPADPTLPAYAHTATWYGMSLDIRVRALGLPALRLVADDLVIDAGEGPPAAVLHASAYELTMALTGRRSRTQIRSMDWMGDPTAHLDILSLYAPPA